MQKKYEMFIETDRKVFRVYADGFFSMEDGIEFHKEFVQKSKNLLNYTLIVDAKGVKPSSPEVAESLKDMIKMYIETPFDARYIVKQESAVGQMQSNRLIKGIIKELGVEENIISYVKNKEEVYKIIG